MKNILLLILFTQIVSAQNYPVGHTSLTFTDASRSNRSIPCEVFYPATNAGNNQPVATDSFPVIVFGHGFAMTFDAYAPFYDSLAANGYVVALPTTEGGTIAPPPNHTDFGKDLVVVLKSFLALDTSSASIFYQKVRQIGGIGGHSMGGGCTYLSNQFNSPAVCNFTFSAANTNPSAIAVANQTGIPNLLFGGTADCVAPVSSNQLPLYDSIRSACKILAVIDSGRHCQYGAVNTLCSLGEFACPTGTSRQRQIEEVWSYALPFLDFNLKHRNAAFTLLQNRITQHTGATITQNCSTTNIVEQGSNRFLSLYPNPAIAGEVIVTYSLAERSVLRVYSLEGKLATEKQFEANQPIQFAAKEFTVGIYIVQLQTSAGVFTAKWVRE